MFRKYHYSNLISVLIIGFISGLFVLKYSEVFLHKASVAVPVYMIFFVMFIFFLDRSGIENIRFINKKFLAVIVALIVFDAFAWVTFLPRLGNIGRLPAINTWLDALFALRFPYNSTGEPSGFPVLFIIAIPFYLIKNVGYLETSGLLLIGIFIINYSKTPKEGLFRILILFISPVVYYGLAVRSELFFNITLVIGIIYLIEKFLDPERINFNFILLAVLSGLVLSTRSIVLLVYAVYFLYLFRNRIFKGIVFILITAAVFLLTILPFYIWNPAGFIEAGPFAVQSSVSFLPVWSIILFVLMSVYLGWGVANINEVFFSAGILMFLPVLLSMLYKILDLGFYGAIINDGFDLSYFIFCVPFFVLAISDYKVDKFLNRIETN